MANKTMYCDTETARRITGALFMRPLKYWANLLDVSEETVANYMTGRTQLKVAQLKLICVDTGISADWILGLREEKFCG